MIGIDTNVLVRYLQGDDPGQAVKANALMQSLTKERRGYISLVSLIEVVWTLRPKFKLDRKSIISVVDSLLRAEELEIEQPELLRKALYLFEDSRADFSGCVIAQSGRAAGCDHTATFDQVAAKTTGMRLL